ncbi:MAG: phage tail protein [Bacteroidia bacterium]
MQAQNVGINTSVPDASSILDITHTNRGLLIPRIVLTDVTVAAPITTPALSLLVFNTNTTVGANGVKPGYYYWNGTQWVGIGTGNAWELLGNTGTNAATNFIGTTDAQDLVFKTNGVENMRVRTNGRVSIGYADNTLYDFGHQLNVKNHMSLKRWGTAPNYVQTRYNGTEASPTAVLNGDWVGSLTFEASDGGANRPPVANIRILAKENVTATASGGDMVFYTTPIGTISPNERVRITENGYVGIGTTTPNARTHIYEPTGFAGTVNPLRIGLNVEIPPQSSNGYYIFKGSGGSLLATGVVYGLGLDLNPTATTTGTRYGVYIENETQNYFSNNVGIGTAAPANKLEITHGTAGNSGLRFTNLPNATALSTDVNGDVIPTTLNPANALYWGLTGNSGTTPATNFVGTTDAQDFVTRTNSIERMRVTSAGNVGIGTNAPTAPLTIGDGVANRGYLRLNGDLANGPVLQLNDVVAGGRIYNIYSGFPSGSGNFSVSDLTAGNLPRFNITSTGNVGIGTTTPDYKLNIETADISLPAGYGKALKLKATFPAMELEGTGGGANKSGFITYDSQITGPNPAGMKFFVDETPGTLTPTTPILTLKSNQNVGVGNNSPSNSAKLDVASTTSGFAMPRMTSVQRKAIVAPIAGLQVYDTDLKGYYYYDGAIWDCVSVSAGTVNYFANATAPHGYLACAGQAVNRTTYAELFTAIGTLYGVGDGATTFNLPDLRGEFVRGVDNAGGTAKGADAGRIIGTGQKGTLTVNDDDGGGYGIYAPQGKTGNCNINQGIDAVVAPYTAANFSGTNLAAILPVSNPDAYSMSAWLSAASSGGVAGGMTRPRNVAMLPCIKF